MRIDIDMNGDAFPVLDALWFLPAGVGYTRPEDHKIVRTNRYEEFIRLLKIWNLQDLKYIFFFCGVAVIPMWLLQFVFLSFRSWTPGCRMLRLRVITVDGEAPGPRRALRRVAGAILALPCLGAGWFLPLISHDDRTWSDIWSNTRLVMLE